MLDKAKKDLVYLKHQILMIHGIASDKITDFDDELYNKLNKVYFNSIPVSILVKYLDSNNFPEYSADRIAATFLSISDALLARGKIDYFNLEYGMENIIYEWLEIGDYVYDLITMLRFKKDYYYKMFSPKEINKITKKDYLLDDDNIREYNFAITTNIDDLKPNTEKMRRYYHYILNIKNKAYLSRNVYLIRDLKDHLFHIDFDENQFDKNKKLKIN